MGYVLKYNVKEKDIYDLEYVRKEQLDAIKKHWDKTFDTFPFETAQVLDGINKNRNIQLANVLEIHCRTGKWSREIY